MPNTLLLDRLLYRLVSTSVNDGGWVDGVYFEGASPVLTFPSFNGDWEPLDKGQIRTVLPEGINTTDAILVFSKIELDVTINNNGNVKLGDSIFLEDPTVITNTIEYIVFDKEVWLTNTGFTLLEVDTFDYICIRKELQ